MTGIQHDTRVPGPPVLDEIPADDRPLDDDLDEELPSHLDVPIGTPVEDVIESLQSAGDLDDDDEPRA